MRKKLLILLLAFVVVLGVSACDRDERQVKLDTPTGAVFDSQTETLSWSAVDNAVGYSVSILDDQGAETEVIDVTDAKIDLKDRIGEYSVAVRAKGNGKKYLDSDLSDALDIKVLKKLSELPLVFRNADTGMCYIYFKSVPNVAEYRFRISSVNFQKDVDASDVNDDINAIFVTLGDNFGQYVLDYKLLSASDEYRDSVWRSVDVVYSRPVGARVLSENVTADRRAPDEVFVPFDFGDAFTFKVKKDGAELSSELYSIDYFGGALRFASSYLTALSVSKHDFVLSTDLGDVAFSLTVTDSAEPYLISKNAVYHSGAGDMDIMLNPVGRSIVALRLSDSVVSVDDYAYSDGVLSVSGRAYENRPFGEYTLRITLSDAYVLEMPVTLAGETDGVYAAQTEFLYDKAFSSTEICLKLYNFSASALSTAGEPFLTDGRAVTSNDAKIGRDGDAYTYTLTSRFLSSLSVGRHTLALNSVRTDLFADIVVIDSATIPYDIHVGIRNGQKVLLWDDEEYQRSIDAGGYTIEVKDTNGTRVVTGPDNCIACAELTADDYYFVRIKSNYGNVYSAETAVIVNDIPDEYSVGNYTFLGIERSLVISDESELSTLIAYAYYNRIRELYFYNNIISSKTFAEIWSSALNAAKNDSELGYLRNGLSASYRSQSNGVYKLTISLDNNASKYLNPTKSTGQTVVTVAPSVVITEPCLSTDGRPVTYVFALDRVTQSEACSTSSQLFYLAEHNVRPLVEEGSAAERMYEKARAVLREIIDDGMTDFEKVHAMYDWMILNTTYDKLMADSLIKTLSNSDALTYKTFYLEGVFDDGVAVCDGYSKAFVLMCALEGIPCVRVGGVVGSANHAWNKVYIDGNWYEVDVTWGNFSSENAESIGRYTEYICHRYLFCDNAYLNADHTEKSDYKYKKAALKGIDVYDMSDEDYMIKVSSYDEIADLINNELKNRKYLELDISAVSDVAATLNDGTGITVSDDDYLALFKGYRDDTLVLVWMLKSGPDIAVDEYVYDKKSEADMILDCVYDGSIDGVYLDEQAIAADNYSFSDGKLTLCKSFLDSCNVGTYTLRVITAFGADSIVLTVSDTRAASIEKSDIIMDNRSEDSYVISGVFYEDTISSVTLKRADNLTPIELSARDYAISADSGKITLYGKLAIRLEKGEYVLHISTLLGGENDITLIVTDTVINGVYALIDNYYYDKKSAGDMVFSVYNLNESQLSGNFLLLDSAVLWSKGTDYSVTDGDDKVTVRIYAAAMSKLTSGDYKLLVNNAFDPVYIDLNVSDSAAVPYAFRMDYNAELRPVLLWDYDGIADGYTVSINGVGYDCDERCFVLPAGDYSTVAFTVTANGGAASSGALDLPYADDPSYFETLSLGDKRFNKYISSVDELADVLEYAMFAGVDSVALYYAAGDVDDDEITMLKNVTSDKVEADCKGLYSSLSYSIGYDPLSKAIELKNVVVSFVSPTRLSGIPDDYVSESSWLDCPTTVSSRTTESVLPYFKTERAAFSVTTGEQLLYAVSKGYLPVPANNSAAKALLDEAKRVLINLIDDDMTDIEKAHAIHDYLIRNIRYDKYLTDNLASIPASDVMLYRDFYLEGALLDGVAVCEGFAKAFMLLCELEGIPAIVADGNADGVAHAWNKVYINNAWSVVDVTFDNLCSYDASSGKYVESGSHAFLLIDDWARAASAVEVGPEVIAEDSEILAVFSFDENDKLYSVASSSELSFLINEKLFDEKEMEIILGYLDVYDDIDAEMAAVSYSQLLRGRVVYRVQNNCVAIKYKG